MNVLIFGRTGQLARALASLVPHGMHAEFLGRGQCELRDPVAVRAQLERAGAEVVINATSFTNVEQAERDRDAAFAINGVAVGELARACAARRARLIHVSTDYVFDGAAQHPYTPEAAPAPLNVYGASKLDGERRIAATPGLDWLIARTAWLYSCHGRNFLLTMLGLLRTRGVVSVVKDQVGSPTSARSLARALWRAVESPGARGLVHVADTGAVSWWEFASAIATGARARGLLDAEPMVNAITTAEYPTLARRPPFSALDARATLAAWGLAPTPWTAALGATLDELALDGSAHA
jgi:dTDP-4-dehydrorhamnose reductase